MREADVQVSVMVLVVSSLFPAFLSPSCLCGGGGDNPGSREALPALSERRAKGAQASALLLHAQDR